MCFVSNTSECVCVKYLSFLLVLPRILIYDILCLYRLVVEHSWCKACSEIQKIPNKKIFSCCTVILDITQRGSTPRSTLCTFSFTSEETRVNCRWCFSTTAMRRFTSRQWIIFVLVWDYASWQWIFLCLCGIMSHLRDFSWLCCCVHDTYLLIPLATVYPEIYKNIGLKTIPPG